MTSSIKTNNKYSEIEDLLTSIDCKEEQKARKYMTAETEYNYARYAAAIKQKDLITDYNISVNTLVTIVPRIPHDLAELLVTGVEDYHVHLTKEEINRILDVVRAERIDTYVERNDYYRMLMGLPPIDTKPEDFVYYKGHPIHSLSLELFFECKYSGYLDVQIRKHPEKSYLGFIGKDISLVHAHDAAQFEVLWTAEGFIYNKYRESFNKERLVYMKTIHSDYLCSTTDYAEARELVTLKLQSIIIYKLEMSSNELDKAEYSAEEATKIWAEFGLSFPQNMIESYRNTTTFLLNYLVSMKGTNKVMEYISTKLFAGIKLYKYFIRKTHKLGVTFPLPEDTRPEDFYNIEFILRPWYATNITDYKQNDLDDKILSYDEVVAMDPRWRDSSELKDAVFNSDFSYVESKYLSLDNFVDLTEFTGTFSVLTRVLIEHRSILETKNILMPSIGYAEDAFTILVYYLALITRMIEGKDVVLPDSLEDIGKVLGFRIPENLAELRVKFAWFFARSQYSHLLDEFPDCISSNDSFFNFVKNTDKIIGLDSYMYDLLESCENWPEYDLASSIFDLVKYVNTSPQSYKLEGTNVTYKDWLLKNAPAVYAVYSKVVIDKEMFYTELDTLTQALINFFEDAVKPAHDPKNIVSVINTFGIMANGVSKYLLYILNLFKSYSSEFLNENVAFYTNPRYNMLKEIDNVQIRGGMNLDFIQNYSDWDNVIVSRIFKLDVVDSYGVYDDVIATTPFGDVKYS